MSFQSKHKLYRALVISICLSVSYGQFLLNQKIQAFEMKCLRTLHYISCMDHMTITNHTVRGMTAKRVGPRKSFLATVNLRKLNRFGYVPLKKVQFETIMQRIVEGKRNRERKCQIDNIKQWTGMNLAGLLSHSNDMNS